MGRAARIHKANGGWRFRFNGRAYWRAEYADAVRLFSEIVGEHGTPYAPITVAEIIPHWQISHPSKYHEYTIESLNDWGGELDLDRVGDDFLEKFRDHLVDSKYSPETVRKMVFAASGALRLAVKRGWLHAMPAVPRCPSPPPRPKGLSAPQLSRLIRTLESRPTSDHVAPLVRFAADTGMRPGEVCRLRWEQIDLEHGTIVMREHKTASKTGSARIVVLPQPVIADLRAMERCGPYVFTNRSGKPYTRSGLKATLSRYGVTPNQLRHTFAQSMIDSGVMPELVTAMLGHRTSKMVWQYAAIHAERLRDALASVRTPTQRASDASIPALTSSAPARETRRAASPKRRKG